MSEWLIHCTDGLKSGAYYASVDIHGGEQPVMILFMKDGEKTFVVGQGEPVNPHGSLIDVDSLRADWLENGENEYVYDTNAFLYSLDDAPIIIEASE